MSQQRDLSNIIGKEFPIIKNQSYTNQNLILYALSIGLSKNLMNQQDLKYTFEMAEDFSAFPTFSITCYQSSQFVEGFIDLNVEGLDLFKMLHGSERFESYFPIQPNVQYQSEARILDIGGKAKASVIEVEFLTREMDGEKRIISRRHSSLFFRGLTGVTNQAKKVLNFPAKPSRNPDKVVEIKTSQSQALIYRLNGDANPLHADFNMAAVGGFDKPILHGLCFYGMACKVVIANFLDNDGNRFKACQGKFLSHVFPGETLSFQLWKEGDVIHFVGSTTERKLPCISGYVETLPAPKI